MGYEIVLLIMVDFVGWLGVFVSWVRIEIV